MRRTSARVNHVKQEQRLAQIVEDAHDIVVGVPLGSDDITAAVEGYPLNKEELKDPEIGVVTSGICYQYVKEALPEASVFKLGLVNPLPLQDIAAFAKKVNKLYVIEEGNPFLEEQIRAAGIPVHGGKELFTIQGEYSANMIRKAFGIEVPEGDAGRRDREHRCSGKTAASLRGMSA